MVEEELAKTIKDVESVDLVEGDPSKTTKVGGELKPLLKKEMVEILKKNLDIFTWTCEDMLGIDNNVKNTILMTTQQRSPSSKDLGSLL